MRRQRRADTGCELALRRELWGRGLRYRVDVRPEPTVRRRADVVFRRARVAIFVDGCFWHSCPEHGSTPKTHQHWWAQKLARTMERDRETDRILEEAGWTVIRVWEHEDPKAAADRVAQLIERNIASHQGGTGEPR